MIDDEDFNEKMCELQNYACYVANDYDNDRGETNIIVGQNGSGKSFFLKHLSHEFAKTERNVIVIANTLHDKFRRNSRFYHFYGLRQGRKSTSALIKDSIQKIDSDANRKLNSLGRTLRYLRFESVIGIKLNNANWSLINGEEDAQIAEKHIDEFASLQRMRRYFKHDDVLWIPLEESRYEVYDKTDLIDLIKSERSLIDSGAISSIELFLSRNECTIPLLNASSGELTILLQLFFIASNIEERSVILVDEPENSLHVKWQLEYLNHILDIFHYYNVCVYVATHSPILVSGTLSSFPNSRVFEMENLSIKPVSNAYTGIEQELYSLFNVITPSNHFLSQKIIALINRLDSGDVSRSLFQDELASLKRSCYDTRQQELIEMIRDRISR